LRPPLELLLELLLLELLPPELLLLELLELLLLLELLPPELPLLELPLPLSPPLLFSVIAVNAWALQAVFAFRYNFR
jgi:hypothetical protein